MGRQSSPSHGSGRRIALRETPDVGNYNTRDDYLGGLKAAPTCRLGGASPERRGDDRRWRSTNPDLTLPAATCRCGLQPVPGLQWTLQFPSRVTRLLYFPPVACGTTCERHQGSEITEPGHL